MKEKNTCGFGCWAPVLDRASSWDFSGRDKRESETKNQT